MKISLRQLRSTNKRAASTQNLTIVAKLPVDAADEAEHAPYVPLRERMEQRDQREHLPKVEEVLNEGRRKKSDPSNKKKVWEVKEDEENIKAKDTANKKAKNTVNKKEDGGREKPVANRKPKKVGGTSGPREGRLALHKRKPKKKRPVKKARKPAALGAVSEDALLQESNSGLSTGKKGASSYHDKYPIVSSPSSASSAPPPPPPAKGMPSSSAKSVMSFASSYATSPTSAKSVKTIKMGNHGPAPKVQETNQEELLTPKGLDDVGRQFSGLAQNLSTTAGTVDWQTQGMNLLKTIGLVEEPTINNNVDVVVDDVETPAKKGWACFNWDDDDNGSSWMENDLLDIMSEVDEEYGSRGRIRESSSKMNSRRSRNRKKDKGRRSSWNPSADDNTSVGDSTFGASTYDDSRYNEDESYYSAVDDRTYQTEDTPGYSAYSSCSESCTTGESGTITYTDDSETLDDTIQTNDSRTLDTYDSRTSGEGTMDEGTLGETIGTNDETVETHEDSNKKGPWFRWFGAGKKSQKKGGPKQEIESKAPNAAGGSSDSASHDSGPSTHDKSTSSGDDAQANNVPLMKTIKEKVRPNIRRRRNSNSPLVMSLAKERSKTSSPAPLTTDDSQAIVKNGEGVKQAPKTKTDDTKSDKDPAVSNGISKVESDSRPKTRPKTPTEASKSITSKSGSAKSRPKTPTLSSKDLMRRVRTLSPVLSPTSMGEHPAELAVNTQDQGQVNVAEPKPCNQGEEGGEQDDAKSNVNPSGEVTPQRYVRGVTEKTVKSMPSTAIRRSKLWRAHTPTKPNLDIFDKMLHAKENSSSKPEASSTPETLPRIESRESASVPTVDCAENGSATTDADATADSIENGIVSAEMSATSSKVVVAEPPSCQANESGDQTIEVSLAVVEEGRQDEEEHGDRGTDLPDIRVVDEEERDDVDDYSVSSVKTDALMNEAFALLRQ